jgi:hypothetical protein
MLGILSRTLFLIAGLGLMAACDEPAPMPEKPAPKAAVAAPSVKKPVAAAPVVKKSPPMIDFDDRGEGSGGGGGGWSG